MSEVLLSYVKKNAEVFRFDSNYFQKLFLEQEQTIRKHQYETLKTLGVELKSFGAYSLNNQVEYLDKGVPFVRGVNMKRGKIVFDNMIYITPEANELLWKSEVKPEMVLLSMSGTIGDVAIASPKWNYPINSNQDIAKIDTKGKINPYILYSFLLSKFGQSYLLREARGSVQQHVFLSQIEQFEMPIFSNAFVQTIQHSITQAENKSLEAEKAYTTAENILLAEICLTDFIPSHDPVNIKTFSESFAISGRLDAEYYQRKYDDYTALIHAYKGGAEPVAQACPPRMQNFTPLENTEYKYIELSNIGKSGDINGCTVDVGANLPSRARRLVHTGDVIISSIEGSLDSCALVGAEYDNALCSTGFYVINSTVINAETLLVLFKSPLLQNLLKKNCSGTILTAINKDEFLSIPVPLIDPAKQSEIAALITQSFALKKQSEHLLDVSKRAVEIAIEQDEAAAMRWIGEQTERTAK